MRTVVLRVVALAVLLLLVLVAVLTISTLRRLPDTLVYYVSTGETTFRLEAVGRRVSGSSPAEVARGQLEELVRGPSAEERRRGLSSSVPSDVRLLGLELEDDILTVDLSEEFEQGGGTAQMQARLHQLFYTLTSPSAVQGVALRVEGDPVTVFGGEGIIVDSPWLRRNHPDDPVW